MQEKPMFATSKYTVSVHTNMEAFISLFFGALFAYQRQKNVIFKISKHRKNNETSSRIQVSCFLSSIE